MVSASAASLKSAWICTRSSTSAVRLASIVRGPGGPPVRQPRGRSVSSEAPTSRGEDPQPVGPPAPRPLASPSRATACRTAASSSITLHQGQSGPDVPAQAGRGTHLEEPLVGRPGLGQIPQRLLRQSQLEEGLRVGVVALRRDRSHQIRRPPRGGLRSGRRWPAPGGPGGRREPTRPDVPAPPSAAGPPAGFPRGGARRQGGGESPGGGRGEGATPGGRGGSSSETSGSSSLSRAEGGTAEGRGRG